MSSAGGTVTVCFNGEIYNHALLRQLEGAGHRYQTHSDTETTLHACEWGAGMRRASRACSLGLWTASAELPSRPPGREAAPLHLAGGTAFASEIAGLLALPELLTAHRPGGDRRFPGAGYVPDPHYLCGIPTAYQRCTSQRCGAARPSGRCRATIGNHSRQASSGPTEASSWPTGWTRCGPSWIADVLLGAFRPAAWDSSLVVARQSRACGRRRTTGHLHHRFQRAGRAPSGAGPGSATGHCHHARTAPPTTLAAARHQAGIFGEPFGDHLPC